MADKVESYKKLLKRLLPPGRAWEAEDGGVLSNLLQGLAVELSRVDLRGQDLLKETDPRTTYELITDWERICGLPDDCTGLAVTMEERRKQIVARLLLSGPQNKQLFVDLANSLGYTIDVTDVIEYHPFLAGYGAAGEQISNGDWVYAFKMVVPIHTLRYFTAGFHCAGDRVVEFGDAVLECVINDHKPAHAIVIFIYE
jgi:uncharacterized protein YmfQ (DUF2313 family)